MNLGWAAGVERLSLLLENNEVLRLRSNEKSIAVVPVIDRGEANAGLGSNNTNAGKAIIRSALIMAQVCFGFFFNCIILDCFKLCIISDYGSKVTS